MKLIRNTETRAGVTPVKRLLLRGAEGTGRAMLWPCPEAAVRNGKDAVEVSPPVRRAAIQLVFGEREAIRSIQPRIGLGELIQDTIEVHGHAWTAAHYSKRMCFTHFYYLAFGRLPRQPR